MRPSVPGPGEPNGEFEGAIKHHLPAAGGDCHSGPTGQTADLRPVFGFTTGNAATVQCSVDKGTPAFAACAAHLPAGLEPGPR